MRPIQSGGTDDLDGDGKKVRNGKKRVSRQMAETEEEKEHRIYFLASRREDISRRNGRSLASISERDPLCQNPKWKKRRTHELAQNKKK